MQGRTTSQRWEALDLLRGLSIIGMLLNLNVGAWNHVYPWLEHAKWEGLKPIDLVAPVFLVCVGAALPLSISRRLDQGASRGEVVKHILWRALALVGIGFLLNLYPAFDWAHVRVPGVLQRIGLTYGLVGLFLVAIARPGGGERFPIRVVAAVTAGMLVAYWALLYFVPSPGYGAPGFDPVGSWPSVIDRAVIGTDHMFRWWPVNGRVVFDPEGILSTWPAAAEVLAGALIGLLYAKRPLRPIFKGLIVGALLVGVGQGLSHFCPIIKNIWTPTFVLFTVGAALFALAGLEALRRMRWFAPWGFPARVFGANPLLVYVLSFLLDPIWGLRWIPAGAGAPQSLRGFSQDVFGAFLPPEAASLAFGVLVLALLFAVAWACWKKRWFLKL
jgi:predicted acyltransferase